ncbi:Os06g0476666 [Oryza sativa Japonica Group]|uniref:Os06g0476666 protein n=1 Tax=Oryza sativa subsp. japonica TaxID=39947 RepID=C7J3K6_ORYSJ|nr:Os06g0476666 [Oryza sativa Japonica Group]|eukprot:NP_001174789.1 Os06g0476666 [Oryza sativa Japonica Group]
MAGEVRSEVASTTAVKSVERRSIARPLVSSVVGCPTASLVAPSLLSLWRFLRCPVANPRFTAVGCPDCLCRRAALLHLCTTAQSHQHTSNPPSQQAQDAQHSCTPHLNHELLEIAKPVTMKVLFDGYENASPDGRGDRYLSTGRT